MSALEDKFFFFHQKADITDNLLWNFYRNQRVFNSAACYTKIEKSVQKDEVYNRNERVVANLPYFRWDPEFLLWNIYTGNRSGSDSNFHIKVKC